MNPTEERNTLIKKTIQNQGTNLEETIKGRKTDAYCVATKLWKNNFVFGNLLCRYLLSEVLDNFRIYSVLENEE
jgi:hypothetical protein